jgi:hypothetical protein
MVEFVVYDGAFLKRGYILHNYRLMTLGIFAMMAGVVVWV